MNNLMDNLVLGSFILVNIFILSLTCLIISTIRNNKRRLILDEYEININTNISEDKFRLLDLIITECFSEYTVLNINYKNIEYINSDLEHEIVREVSAKIIERLSPVMLTQLGLVYNTESMAKIISERVYLHTIGFVMEHNVVKQ